jgi:hypothetical protein
MAARGSSKGGSASRSGVKARRRNETGSQALRSRWAWPGCIPHVSGSACGRVSGPKPSARWRWRVRADAKGAQDKRRGRAARGGAGRAGRAWRKAERLFDEAVQAAEAGKQAETALGWCAAEGHLLSRGEAQEPREKASEKLSGSLWSNVRRLLKAERTLRHSDRIAKPRAEVVPELMRRASLTR